MESHAFSEHAWLARDDNARCLAGRYSGPYNAAIWSAGQIHSRDTMWGAFCEQAVTWGFPVTISGKTHQHNLNLCMYLCEKGSIGLPWVRGQDPLLWTCHIEQQSSVGVKKRKANKEELDQNLNNIL